MELNLSSIKIAKSFGFINVKKKIEYIYKDKKKFKYNSYRLTKKKFLKKINEKKNNF